MSSAWRRSEVIFDAPSLKTRVAEYDQTLAQKDFWTDQERAQKLLKERARLQDELSRWEAKEKELEEILILSDFAKETEDLEDVSELERRVEALDGELNSYEIERMLAGENDKENAIIYINAGAGGTEAQDWAEMLLRMYLKWAEKKGSRPRWSIFWRVKRRGSRTSRSLSPGLTLTAT